MTKTKKKKWCYDNVSSSGDDYLALLVFLASFGILKVPTVCPLCGAAVAAKTQRGRKKLRRVDSGCAKWVSATAGTVLETFSIPLKKWLQILALLGLYSEDKTLMDALNSLLC